MPKHPHYEVMMEWAADTSKVVQYYNGNTWEDMTGQPPWHRNSTYRIKPEKKPDVVTECKITKCFGSILWNSVHNTVSGANLRLTYCGETGKLIKAEVLHAE